MNIQNEAASIAADALKRADNDIETARECLYEICENHEISMYADKAIEFCSRFDTDAGEAYLKDFGGIARADDSFSDVACRIAFATLYVRSQEMLEDFNAEIEKNMEENLYEDEDA